MRAWPSPTGGELISHGGLVVLAVLVTSSVYLVGRWLFTPRRPPGDGGPHDGGQTGPQSRGLIFPPLETAGTIPDRRASPRRKGNSVPVLLRFDAAQEPFPGWVVNRSGGGLRVVTDRPVTVQTVLQIRPDSDKAEGWTEAVARSLRREEGDQYELGLQFLSKPSWGYMMQFG